MIIASCDICGKKVDYSGLYSVAEKYKLTDIKEICTNCSDIVTDFKSKKSNEMDNQLTLDIRNFILNLKHQHQ